MPLSPAALLIQKFGSQTKLADALGVRPSTIAHWVKRNGRVPSGKQREVLQAASKANIHLTPAELVLGSKP